MIRILVKSKLPLQISRTTSKRFCTEAAVKQTSFTFKKGLAYAFPILLASGSAAAAYKYYYGTRKFIPKPSFAFSSTLIPEDTFNTSFLSRW